MINEQSTDEINYKLFLVISYKLGQIDRFKSCLILEFQILVTPFSNCLLYLIFVYNDIFVVYWML